MTAAPDRLRPDELLARLVGAAGSPVGRVTHVRELPARAAKLASWPSWLPEHLRAALDAAGLSGPWTHQLTAAELAHAGQHVVVCTGTGSGKSLTYQLPVLARLASDAKACALYLAPTKALAADQLRAIQKLAPADIRPAALDGDTPLPERDWIRAHARFVFTNPDLVHHTLLPRHDNWAAFLGRLTYVIVDECHSYRGVFGSHVAQVLRRLRRIAARHGSCPTFILASATVSDPAASAARLVGLPVAAVTEDASPRGGLTFALWEPPLLAAPVEEAAVQSSTAEGRNAGRGDDPAASIGESRLSCAAAPSRPAEPTVAGPTVAGPGGPARGGRAGSAGLEAASWMGTVRRSALRETADLLAGTIASGGRTVAFVRSRRGAELVASMARTALTELAPHLVDRVAAYRAGYLREERRELEQGLLDGHLLGLASTNALELGVDLTGLDAVLLAGYPGTLASLWQQAGRAGRAGRPALCVLVARDDPLDTYLIHHPEALFDRPFEATVLDPTNPYVLGPHLCAAAAELPLTDADIALFGGDPAAASLTELEAAGLLRRRSTGWYWTASHRPSVDLRGTGGQPVSVVESATGRLLGTVDAGSAPGQVHPGAVYLHQGATFVVERLDLDDAVALVRAEEPDYSTHARDVTSLSVVTVTDYRDAGPVGLFLGTVDVTSQVVSYHRRRLGSGQMIGTFPLDLPQRQLRTTAVWWTISSKELEAAGVPAAEVPGALHAAEHAAIGLLPLIATCDRWDIGGLSTAVHQDTEAPTIFVYDGHPGGAGFAERAYHAAPIWLAATQEAIAGCGCESGCPSCVQSPKCGNGNDPLSKWHAVDLLACTRRWLEAERQR